MMRTLIEQLQFSSYYYTALFTVAAISRGWKLREACPRISGVYDWRDTQAKAFDDWAQL